MRSNVGGVVPVLLRPFIPANRLIRHETRNRGPLEFLDSPLDWFRGWLWSFRRYWIQLSVDLLGVSGLLEFVGEME